MPEEKRFGGKRFLMYVIGFVFNLSYALPTYVNSSFLAKFTGDGLVGIIYAASSIIAIMAFVEMSEALRRFGNLKTTIGLLFMGILSLAGMATGQTALVIVSSFILNFVAIALMNFTLDIFLEQFSSDARTGKIRGTFFTVANAAWLIAPLVTSATLKDNIYGNLYALAGLLLIPVLILAFFGLRDVKDPVYSRLPFWKGFALVWADRNIKGILFLSFLLQFFYAWMVIYTPIYLHETVGFDWTEIGFIFTFMLVPFVVVGAPLGRIADRHGEKKVLTAAFILMGVATTLIGFVTDHNAVIWALILFFTRLGAASAEVMIDIYFFKQVNAANVNIIGFARMIRPLAYIVSPVIATILFLGFDIKGLFVFLGLLMLYGLRYTYTLKETRVLQS
ncbi:MAG TPA: MFS transporter [Candidatus Paceibacterota bacterium]|jgi:MFS family permease|nr:MFS transporter [Candidatus Paceibacterota bacterium]